MQLQLQDTQVQLFAMTNTQINRRSLTIELEAKPLKEFIARL